MDRQQAIAIIKNEIYLAKLGERILTTRQLEKVLNYLENL